MNSLLKTICKIVGHQPDDDGKLGKCGLGRIPLYCERCKESIYNRRWRILFHITLNGIHFMLLFMTSTPKRQFLMGIDHTDADAYLNVDLPPLSLQLMLNWYWIKHAVLMPKSNISLDILREFYTEDHTLIRPHIWSRSYNWEKKNV